MKNLFNRNLLNLIIGELNRSVKYKVLTIGTGLSFVWLIIIFFTRKNIDDLSMIVPLLIFTDAAMMSVILIGAGIFFEKQEGSIRSLLISPVTLNQILIAKLINSIISSLISAIIVSVGTVFLTDVKINIGLLLIYVVITVAAHGAIGFALAMISKDFNSMLVNFMLFMLIMVMPPILLMLNVIPSQYDLLILISPSEAGSMLLNSTIGGADTAVYKIIISIIYLIAITFILMKYFVYPRYQKDAVRG